MDIEVRIRGLMMDPATNMPIVVLKDVGSDTVMPIWVGIFEANAIAIEIEKVAPPRPMTHDLARNFMRHMNAQLEKIVINELRDDTFFAVLWLRQDDELITLDARPSDAIAIGLRFNVPIYTYESILSEAGIVFTESQEEDEPLVKREEPARPAPATPEKFKDIPFEQLKTLLEEALEKEDYERAARIRDELNKRN